MVIDPGGYSEYLWTNKPYSPCGNKKIIQRLGIVTDKYTGPVSKINSVPETTYHMIMLLFLDIIRNLQFRSYLLLFLSIFTWLKTK
jgi:hypothetical protein